MPANYSGNSAGITARQQPIIANPIGTDPRNAASVATPLETLANFVQFLQQNAALLGTAGNASQIRLGLSDIATPALKFTSVTPDGEYQLLAEWPINAAGTIFMRMFQQSYAAGAPGGVYFTCNAKWQTSDDTWRSDAAGVACLLAYVDGGFLIMRRPIVDPAGAAAAISFVDRIYWNRDGNEVIPATGWVDTTGTPGNATVAAYVRGGRVALATSALSVRIDHPSVTANSVVHASMETVVLGNSLTATIVSAGQIFFYVDAAYATGPRNITWKILALK